MADDTLIFKTAPFSTDSSAKFLYLDAPRRRILADLIAHLCDGEGPILLVAEPGMGKSMLLDRLAEEANAHNIRIVFSLVNVAAITAASEADTQPTAFLLDDVNALPLGVWHQLIALLRSASPSAPGGSGSRRLPPIVIALTPDLLEWLCEASLINRSAPLDRIFRLPAFAPRDVGRFISLRLRVAGVDRPEVFTSDSIDRIAQVTDGVPARINRICEAALAEAARHGQSDVSVDIVDAAATLVELEMPKPSAAARIPQPIFQPELSAEPSASAVHSDYAPSIGIVGAGYAPVADTEMVRRRIRRRRMPPWSGVAIAVGVAVVGAVAMLGYIAGPTVSRPSPVASAATSSDATAAALDTRPILPPTVEHGLGSAGSVPTFVRPDEQDQRRTEPQRDVLQRPAEDTSPTTSQETSSLEANEDSTYPPPASAGPEHARPEQAAPAPPPEPAVTARPAPPPKSARPAPAADRPQPRVAKSARLNAAAPRGQERGEEPAVGQDPAAGPDPVRFTEEGRPRSVKELIDMGDEFRDAGDNEWARRLYRAAQERGSAKAAVAEAETYDPQYAAASSRVDPEKARRLYSEAARQGDRQAAKRLEELDQWMSERAGR